MSDALLEKFGGAAELEPVRLVDARTVAKSQLVPWQASLASAEAIEAAFEKLAVGDPGTDGRREFLASHPDCGVGGGLAPAIEVRFGLLLPGEQMRPRRTNASSLGIVLAGRARTQVGDREIELAPRDVWTTPSMHREVLWCVGDQPVRYISYSNAALLAKIDALYVQMDPPHEEGAALEEQVAASFSAGVGRAKELAGGPVPLGKGLGALLPYEHLIDPDVVANPPLHWPWESVAPHLGLVRSLGEKYNGRPLWCLYNPATGRRNGTTQSFFATMTSAPPNVVGPAHRHMSSAINYILEGSGFSIVEGKRIEWKAGDIMLSAPGWATHGHGIGPDGAIILTVQDHPLHIGTESLVWQEDVKGGAILTLGAQTGFETNLAAVRGAAAAENAS
jgi:gentisate 1,2-dioxygenase